MPWNAPQRKRFASEPSAFMSILVTYRAKDLEALAELQIILAKNKEQQARRTDT